MKVCAEVQTLTDSSGVQNGNYLIQTVIDQGQGPFLHKHVVTSLYAATDSSNVPGDPGYVAPTSGIYAYSIDLTLTYEGVTYTSDPIWIVWNSGMDNTTVEKATYYFDPLPGDANRDQVVDVGDLGILAANYGLTGGATWDQGDFNDDGNVDVGDLGILAANYGTNASGSSDWASDYAKVLGSSATSSSDTTDDSGESSSSLCSSLGLALITALFFMGLTLIKIEE
jgi:hypothetical protein